MYECPAPYKRIISTAVFRQLLGSNRLVYHKDTSILPERVQAKLEVLKGLDKNRLEFYDAHSPNASFSLQAGAKGMSSISGNFYPEILVWMCNHANDPARQEEVKWLQSEISRVDPLIHQAYPMSAKYFLQKRGLPLRTISRTFALELTPDQKKTLDQIHADFLGWCEKLGIQPVR
jgi:4-hydroxy-tetrahydrodipicolinate synthase